MSEIYSAAEAKNISTFSVLTTISVLTPHSFITKIIILIKPETKK